MQAEAIDEERQVDKCDACGKSLSEVGVITRDVIDPASKYNASSKPARYNCPDCYDAKRSQRRAEYAAAHPPVKSKKKKAKC